MAAAPIPAPPPVATGDVGRRTAASERAPLAAAVLAVALGSRAISLGADRLDELWWLCHVATALMIVGLAAGWARVVAGAWLYHLVWGAPVWLLDAIVAGTTLPSSIAAHVGPLVVGGWWLWRRGRRWPGPVALPAWMVGIAAMIVSRPLTVPAHNVNSAYAVWPPLDRVFASVGSLWIVTGLVCLGVMIAAERLLARWRGARP